jgi:hypothetical protein
MSASARIGSQSARSGRRGLCSAAVALCGVGGALSRSGAGQRQHDHHSVFDVRSVGDVRLRQPGTPTKPCMHAPPPARLRRTGVGLRLWLEASGFHWQRPCWCVSWPGLRRLPHLASRSRRPPKGRGFRAPLHAPVCPRAAQVAFRVGRVHLRDASVRLVPSQPLARPRHSRPATAAAATTIAAVPRSALRRSSSPLRRTPAARLPAINRDEWGLFGSGTT